MKYLFLVLLVSQLLSSVFFYIKQNRGDFVGGPISWAKALWLYHAIFSWYLVPLVYLAHPDVAVSLKWVIGLHTLVWWIRGPVELVMIYKFFNWSPRYGITHDVIHSFILLLAVALTARSWDGNLPNWMAYSYALVTIVMLCFETWFAALFLNVRGHADHKIYYAADEPKWIFINRLTMAGLVVGFLQSVPQALLALMYWD